MAIGRPISLTSNIATKNISAIATANQTEFTVTGGYRINELTVYRNGVRLVEGRDFTASDGSTVTLVNGATVSDVIEFSVFDSFNVAGTIVSAASSQNLSGDLNVTGKLYGATVDADNSNIGVGTITRITNTNLVATAATFNSTIHVGSALTANAAGDVESIGIITASSFYGDGSTLTGVGETVNVRTETITVSGVSTFTGVSNFSAAINADATTDSTSTSTGALIVDGGVGIAKNVYIGAGLSVAGTLTYEDVTSVDSVGMVTAKSGVNITGGQLQVGVAYSVGAAGVCTAAGLSIDSDSNKIFLGADKEMQVFHNGTDSLIKDTRNSGTVKIQADNFTVIDKDATETMLSAAVDGAVTLRHNGNTKLETTTTGATISGEATADGLIVGSGITFGSAGVATFSKNVTIDGDVAIGLEGATASGLSPVLQLHQKASTATSYLHITNTDSGVANSDGFVIGFNASNDALIFNKESTPLRLATAGTERLRVTAGGQVGINSSDPDVDLVVSHAGQNTGMGVTVYINSQKNNASAIGSAELRLGFKHSGNNDGKGDAYIKLEEDGTNSFDGNLTIGVPVNNNGGGSTTWDSVKFEGASTGVDISLCGTANGISSVTWDASQNTLYFNDSSEARFGDSGDMRVYHNGTNSYILNTTGQLYIGSDILTLTPANGGEFYLYAAANGPTKLYHDHNQKFETTNDGVNITGFTTTTAGMGVTGGLFEGSFIKAGKLSDNATIGISTANVFYFTTQETTTATPNIVWNDTYSLSSKMKVGDVATVTVITTAAAGGYSANWTVDGNAVTEVWVGGAAPTAGGSSGLDVYGLTILKTGTGTGDSGFKVLVNVVNLA